MGHANTEIANCRFCDEEEESTYHILTNCESLRDKREIVFEERYLDHPYKIKANMVIEYVKKAKIEVFTDQL